ncbi:MAG TPA: methyltransferase domain-containing protein [Actinomycetota bacterium]|nr:methyltransferase domain-containing protein [Actinomycetota bacterium]
MARYFAPARRWIDAEREVVRSARGMVLDAGAGVGRVALHLQDRGHDVVAIDTSPGAIRVCRELGVRRAEVRAVSSVRTADGPFDTFAFFGNNLGLLRDDRHGPWLLRRLRAAATPDARLIGSIRDPYRTDDPDALAYHERNRERGRMAGQTRFRLRYRSHRSAWFDYAAMSLPELTAIAAAGGWHVDRVADDGGPRYGVVLSVAG